MLDPNDRISQDTRRTAGNVPEYEKQLESAPSMAGIALTLVALVAIVVTVYAVWGPPGQQSTSASPATTVTQQVPAQNGTR
ncbi:MAG TPA: hypothetical protein VFV47_01520 [Hyphomicrobiaceae bacterium]|nr:hypothetical protein [Hyphomicrobiaceae bacterium]